MKQLTKYIQEKLHVGQYKKEDPFKFLVQLFKEKVLINQGKIKEDHFEDWNTGMSTLFNVPQSYEYFEDFHKACKEHEDIFQFKNELKKFKYSIGIKNDNKTCITFNFMEGNDLKNNIKQGDIISIDVSTNIRNELLK